MPCKTPFPLNRLPDYRDLRGQEVEGQPFGHCYRIVDPMALRIPGNLAKGRLIPFRPFVGLVDAYAEIAQQPIVD